LLTGYQYPGANDRGGIPEDTENFVHLLRDMKDAFQGEYGISVTLPASYWYLRWFDLQGMQENLDFFNIMTYDIHGVWDASNQHTGRTSFPILTSPRSSWGLISYGGTTWIRLE
jgi:GH18 family chitinase